MVNLLQMASPAQTRLQLPQACMHAHESLRVGHAGGQWYGGTRTPHDTGLDWAPVCTNQVMYSKQSNTCTLSQLTSSNCVIPVDFR